MLVSMKSLPLSLVFVLCAVSVQAETARDTWNQLVGKQATTRPMFGFVENDPALPNVLIYGDSISIGYTSHVRAKLAGKANVYRLHCNGGDSSTFIAKMIRMHEVMRDEKLEDPWSFQWDVIHFNVGLHDIKYLAANKLDKVNGKQVSSIEDYQKNLDEIVSYLKQLAPNAKLIFATTTPVPENEPGRNVGDSEKFNAAAIEVLGKYPEIKINDLFAVTKPNHEKWWSKPGNVHYNQVGTTAQGDEVVRVISDVLAE